MAIIREPGDKYRPVVRVKKATNGVPTDLLISGKRYILNDRSYRPVVKIKKAKKGVPTVLEVDGERYILDHKDGYKGGKKNGKRKKRN